MMTLHEIEFEFLKVLLLGFFFGWTAFSYIGGRYRASRHLREIKWMGKYMELNRQRTLKMDDASLTLIKRLKTKMP